MSTSSPTALFASTSVVKDDDARYASDFGNAGLTFAVGPLLR